MEKKSLPDITILRVDPLASKRVAAAHALGESGSQFAIEALVDAVVFDKDAGVRTVAQDALRHIVETSQQPKETRTDIESRLQERKSGGRDRVHTALDADKDIIGELTAIITSGGESYDEVQRRSAIEALYGLREEPDARKALLRAANHSDITEVQSFAQRVVMRDAVTKMPGGVAKTPEDYIRSAMSRLTKQEQAVMEARFFSEVTPTLKKTGQDMESAVTRERVRQVQLKAIKKINHSVRKQITEDGLPGEERGRIIREVAEFLTPPKAKPR